MLATITHIIRGHSILSTVQLLNSCSIISILKLNNLFNAELPLTTPSVIRINDSIKSTVSRYITINLLLLWQQNFDQGRETALGAPFISHINKLYSLEGNH